MSTSVYSPERAPRLLHAEEGHLPFRRSYFSELIQGLFLRDIDPECRPMMFTSPNPGAGVSFTCSYIATELASLGCKVLLLDAQAVSRLARRPAEEAVKQAERVELSRLWVLGARQLTVRPVDERVPSSSIGGVLTALREEFAHILIDAPALSVSEDAMNLAAAVYGTVLIAQNGATAKEEIVHARNKFVSLGGRVLGAIYNGRPNSSSGSAQA